MARAEPDPEWWWPRPRSRGDVLDLARHLREERDRPRKALLALCALCRVTWDAIELDENRQALEASEDYADGSISQDHLIAVWRDTRFEPVVHCEWVCAAAGPADGLANWSPLDERDRAALEEFHSAHTTAVRSRWWSQELRYAMDVLGFAFTASSLRPEWRTEAVVGLSRQMYNSRDYSPMTVLADALEDAGCDDLDIIAHCRDPGPHVRGCWVLDLVLGLE
jgi:hypothetical protein